MSRLWRRTSIPRNLNNSDLLAKYIFRDKELRADGQPIPSAVKPRDGDMLSLFDTSDFPHDQTCQHGHRYADNIDQGRVHVGYVKFEHGSILNLNLRMIYDNDPPRHVSVEFPDEPEKRRELAKALAATAVVVRPVEKMKYFAPCP